MVREDKWQQVEESLEAWNTDLLQEIAETLEEETDPMSVRFAAMVRMELRCRELNESGPAFHDPDQTLTQAMNDDPFYS